MPEGLWDSAQPHNGFCQSSVLQGLKGTIFFPNNKRKRDAPPEKKRFVIDLLFKAHARLQSFSNSPTIKLLSFRFSWATKKRRPIPDP
jgi:hypothetical protein